MNNYCELYISKEKRTTLIVMLALVAGTVILVPAIFLTALHNGTAGISVSVVILLFVISSIFAVIKYIRLAGGKEETVFVKSIRSSMQDSTQSLEEVFQEINRDLTKDFGNVLVGDKWLVGYALDGRGYRAVRFDQIESFSYTRLRRASDDHKEKKSIRIYTKQQVPLAFRPPGVHCAGLYVYLRERYTEKKDRIQLFSGSAHLLH